jgi:hypothetical protein
MRRMRRRLAASLFFLLLVALPACSFTVPRLDPMPSTALVAPDPPRTLALTFAPDVPDRFVRHMGNYTMTVESWRESLENAFRNGFRKTYAAPKAGTSPDLVLEIEHAELEIGTFDRERDVEQTDHNQARIRFVATLTAKDGTLRRTSGIASRGATMFAGSTAYTSDLLDEDVAASIDSMYEHLAKVLFAPPRVVPAGCVPGQSLACVGPRTCQGYQVCAADGSHFSPCTCGD